jgi:hypothetical protein
MLNYLESFDVRSTHKMRAKCTPATITVTFIVEQLNSMNKFQVVD